MQTKIELQPSKTVLKQFFLLLIAVSSLQSCSDKEDKFANYQLIESHIDLALKSKDIDPEMIRVVQSQSGEMTAATLEEQIFSDDPRFDEDFENDLSVFSHRPRVLVVGDSWAFFQCIFNSMGKTIIEYDAPLKNDYRCLRTTMPGIEARDWLDSKQHKRVIKYLSKNKNIKYMVLTLGGNDLMAQWHKRMSATDEQKIFSQIKSDLNSITQIYQQVNPDLQIIISGYDYPHFLENHKIPLFRRIYERMLKPTTSEMNSGLVRYSRFMSTLNLYNKNTYFVHHLGLSQYHRGVPEYQIPPHQTIPPHLISSMTTPEAYGGLIDYPSSQQSMINWFTIESDAFHLNSTSYKYVLNHVYLSRIQPILD